MTSSTASQAVRAVLDTNVLLSLWVFADSRYAAIRAAVESGRVMALTDGACLAEFERVLGYPAFSLTADSQHDILAAYAGLARPVSRRAPMRLPQCSDRDDQKFLELACGGSAHFLVTSDKALLKLARHKTFRENLRILPPQAFLEDILNAEQLITEE